MFDPGRAQNHAPVDLAEPSSNVEPYYTPGIASTATSHSPEMSQYPRSAATTSDGGYGPSDVSRGPSSASTAGYAGRGAQFGMTPTPNSAPPMPSMPEASQYVTGAGPGAGAAGYNAGHFGPAAGAVAGAAAAGAAGGAMSAKQREAYQERQRMQVANQNQQYPNPYGGGSGSGGASGGYASPSEPMSPTTDGGRQTVVSQDAGPAGDSEPFAQGGEIPPTYDSIRR